MRTILPRAGSNPRWERKQRTHTCSMGWRQGGGGLTEVTERQLLNQNGGTAFCQAQRPSCPPPLPALSTAAQDAQSKASSAREDAVKLQRGAM